MKQICCQRHDGRRTGDAGGRNASSACAASVLEASIRYLRSRCNVGDERECCVEHWSEAASSLSDRNVSCKRVSRLSRTRELLQQLCERMEDFRTSLRCNNEICPQCGWQNLHRVMLRGEIG
jgi:hypothetical protein